MHSDVLSILKSYPKIYLACHVDHVRRRSTTFALSSSDSSLLVHLTSKQGTRASALAQHLGVRPSTLSASLKRLGALGYLRANVAPSDRRQKLLTLTRKGEAALVATSVLDPIRVRALLSEMNSGDRKLAVEGLALLAHAAIAVSTRGTTK
jgi:DNA-binding MarR family transcriptional regulator